MIYNARITTQLHCYRKSSLLRFRGSDAMTKQLEWLLCSNSCKHATECLKLIIVAATDKYSTLQSNGTHYCHRLGMSDENWLMYIKCTCNWLKRRIMSVHRQVISAAKQPTQVPSAQQEHTMLDRKLPTKALWAEQNINVWLQKWTMMTHGKAQKCSVIKALRNKHAMTTQYT
jgi:hypothetical protein